MYARCVPRLRISCTFHPRDRRGHMLPATGAIAVIEVGATIHCAHLRAVREVRVVRRVTLRVSTPDRVTLSLLGDVAA